MENIIWSKIKKLLSWIIVASFLIGFLYVSLWAVIIKPTIQFYEKFGIYGAFGWILILILLSSVIPLFTILLAWAFDNL